MFSGNKILNSYINLNTFPANNTAYEYETFTDYTSFFPGITTFRDYNVLATNTTINAGWFYNGFYQAVYGSYSIDYAESSSFSASTYEILRGFISDWAGVPTPSFLMCNQFL